MPSRVGLRGGQVRSLLGAIATFACTSNPPNSGMALGPVSGGAATDAAGSNAGGNPSAGSSTTGSTTTGNGGTAPSTPTGGTMGGAAGTENAGAGAGGRNTAAGGGASNASGSSNGGSPASGGSPTSTGGEAGSSGAVAAGGTAGSGVGGEGAGGAGSTSGSVFPPNVTTPKIMIVGDSISAGPGCYKKYLKQNLTDNGITNYEFVGEYDDDCGGGVRHSAVSCTTSGQFAEATFTVPNCTSTTYPGLATLVESHNPDLLMLQLGVNDVWGGSAPIEPILANYETLVEQARAHNPNIVVVVAQIHKIITDNCANAASTTNAQALVEAVPAWAESVSTAESPVFTADLWTNSDAHEADDCVHPNDAGAQRMGLNWYNALVDLLE